MAMLKQEFISKVISRFGYYTEKDSEGALSDTYSKCLTKKINFDKLWELFCNEYAGKTPPTGVELKELSKRCLLESVEQPKSNWLQVKVYDPRYKVERATDCFPKGTTSEQIIKTYETMFKCTGWEIISIS
ncbi:MAG: hypothetical protein MJ180_00045 [Candidatus Gastranaerophilales bacterium]|nr:hypothetical protein [Candidatus Gastranaerophilales bacterium]